MTARDALSLALGLLPVLSFLLVLVLLDSYKLVSLRRVGGALLAGAVAAVVSLVLGGVMAGVLRLGTTDQARYLAPVVEEALKGSVIVVLLLRRRVGFLVDAAIYGFALGAGFAAAENLRYFAILGDSSLVLWTIRGFGTAVMHGSVTAILAVIAKQLSDRRGTLGVSAIAPGLLLAILLHSAFNHFFLSPNASTVLMLLVLPGFFALVFRISESRTRDWLGTGFDSDQELFALINAGKVSTTRMGSYLAELKEHLPGTVVADMLCLLRLRLELSLRAKGILIMRKAGFRTAPDPAFMERFAELKYLERSIGPTGLRALAPVLHMSDRDLWQYHVLAQGS